MDSDQLEKALPWEVREKLSFDTDGAMLRNIIAGEVYELNESKLEIVLMAASRGVVQKHLHLIENIKIEIDSIGVEACALVNGFAHLLSPADQQKPAMMLVDLGHFSTKVVVAHGLDIVFCRSINIPANISLQGQDSSATLVEKENAGSPSMQAVLTPAKQKLSAEIGGCVRYHDLMFDNQPIEKVIFVGGKAKNRKLCQQLAQDLRLPAQLGDPLARIDAKTKLANHNDLDDRQINSDWAVAFGLSLGTGA